MGNENEIQSNQRFEIKNRRIEESSIKVPRNQGNKESKDQRNTQQHRIKEFKTEEKNKNNTALAKGRWQTTYYCCVEGCCTYNN
jgi:hypothetical protein